MRNLKFLGLGLIIVLLDCASISAQVSIATTNDQKKPRLFDSMPDRIAVNAGDIGQLFKERTETGKEVNINFRDPQLPGLRGKVVSATRKYDNKIHTLIIRSINFSGATLTLSSSTQLDGTVRYSGRIISFEHGDLYELEKQNEHYMLVKKNFRELISD
jgi:hypothetical protein